MQEDMGSSALKMDLWIRALTAFAFREYAVFGLPPIGNREQTLLVSIAVLFVKGRWRYRFETGFGNFRETPSKVKQVRVMRRVGLFRIGDCAGLDATALEIPYQDPSKSMVVFLPRMERLATFEHSLTQATLLRCVANLSEKVVEVTMPVLRLKKHTELMPTVSLLGCQDVFKNRGNLGASSHNKTLFVSRLTHVLVFQAKAKGGALPLGSTPTGSQTSESKEPLQFTVDRPFLFLVMNRNPDAILVMGSVKRVSSKKTKKIP
ncbi:iris-like [Haemaphysalis longicornis]|uniref:Serpin domain-containing protein n=1 Tax=Haemaphysalis longicornis TaxID=44386 RepID=A0A9J6GBT7_HAELO|nr:hypothetical protein HPB48_023085 [Haemaphysalis longicornis]